MEVLALYENVRPASYPEEALAALGRGGIDAVTLASPSAARNYADLCQERGIEPAAPCAVIGPATRKTAESLNLPVAVMPAEHTAGGMVEALEEYFKSRES